MEVYIKAKRLENVSIPTLKQSDRSFISDQEKANVLGEQFRSVFTQENLDFIPYSRGGSRKCKKGGGRVADI